MKDTLQERMQEALRLTLAGRLRDATQAIRQALKGPAAAQAAEDQAADAVVLDGCVFEVDERDVVTDSLIPGDATTVAAELQPSPQAAPPVIHHGPADADAAAAARGEFIDGAFTDAAQTHDYKLYVPPCAIGESGRGRPLVVMLHGCTQDPDDFAIGTGMNEQAREQGFFLLYPAQSQRANPQRCWNWFKHSHQQRERGEPALIANMTLAVMQERGIDPGRVYIAGLSAGGAMAAIVGAAYPEIFAAVGVHSGLPPGSASDVAGGLALMKTGHAGGRSHARQHAFVSTPAVATPVPTIVFHGDQDPTVHPRNGERVVAAALGGDAHASAAAQHRVEQGASAGGRLYTRSTHRSADGKVMAEHWVVHGAGHAWAGGNARGSHTDSTGPDATAEMLRFFFEQSRAQPR
ncbi:alpha/beta hydrolase family esterase [Rivibacter subsaxonicus]|uniref:Poly(Hydroxyalkanoate) depolymerase family esterase n=1 Tax=Rivibacter subsaxonicus TaxID=457575 RepID=A0A4Q7W2E6_9BURK|nr:PHB depolymerase family esterase [Rivibacter subsaxonicus]RZU03135.1 poly(hydroxyalkanoate) depolymerase family esterase [Rivibacter subsaxonicus]